MKVVVVTGSSGGHITPALAYIEELIRRYPHCRTVLVTPRHELIERFEPCGAELVYTRYIRLSRSFNRRGVLGIRDFIHSFYSSLKILVRHKPDLVVGFGTVHSVSMVLLAWFLRIRTVIHEQNVSPGRANLFLSKFVDLVCVSFQESLSYFPRSRRSVRFTGNPLRACLKRLPRQEAAGLLGLRGDLTTILIMGGSQGSHSLNECVSRAVCAPEMARDLQIIHITGQYDYEQVRQAYERAGCLARVYPFLKEMHYALSLADLVVSRSGATTVQELIRFDLPAVLVPYPFARRHQMANASVLEKAGSAVIIREEELSAAGLRDTLKRMISRPRTGGDKSATYSDAAYALVEATIAS